MGLPRLLAIQLYEISQETAKRAEEIKTDRTLTTEEREGQAIALRETTSQAIVKMIGTSNYLVLTQHNLWKP
jgi:hypothetical protein